MIDMRELSSGHIKLACLAIGGILLLASLLWLFSVESAAAARVAAVDAIGGPILDLEQVRSESREHSEGALVRASGVPVVIEPAQDRQFGIAANALVLERHVEMLQWRELDALGVPTYVREWVDHPVDSGNFAKPQRHQNPGAFPFVAKRFRSPRVELGGVPLVYTIVDAVPGSQQLATDVSALPANLAASFRLHDGALYTSRNPEAPGLGDIRVSWTVVWPRLLTVIGRMDEGAIAASPKLPVPGYLVLIDNMGIDGALPGLPNMPPSPWLQRILALLLGLAGALLGLYGLRGRLELPLAAGVAVVVAALVGVSAWLVVRPWMTLALVAIAAAVVLLLAYFLRRSGFTFLSATRRPD